MSNISSQLHVPPTIDQTYVEGPIFDLVGWELYLIVTCAVLLLWCIICNVMGIKSKHNNTSTTDVSIFSYKSLTVFILIASLLFATYCGVLFLLQNDRYWKKYSVPFECKVDANDTCIVFSDALIWTKSVESEYEANGCDSCGGGTFTGIENHFWAYQISDYSHFYNDTFEPYVRGLDDAVLMERFETNPILRIRFKTQDVSAYPDRWNAGANSYERVRMGYLYLSENGLSDSDVTLAQHDYDSECHDCCSCCCERRQAFCFCAKKGKGEGCECYCFRQQVWDYESELVVDPGETCCECCCGSCGGLPCHTTCCGCMQCCVGFSVCICIFVILIILAYYWTLIEGYYGLGSIMEDSDL
eukprot:26504_1